MNEPKKNQSSLSPKATFCSLVRIVGQYFFDLVTAKMNEYISLSPKERRYIRVYKRIKWRCKWQRYFSFFLLGVFFMLQYSVPIFIVVLGSVASSREQLTIFFSSNDGDSSDSNPKNSNSHGEESEKYDQKDSEVIVSRIIYLVGLTTILLGVIKNIVRPAESYDTSAKYNNKFFNFEQNFDWEFLEISPPFDESVHKKDAVNTIMKFLIKKNDELCRLIEEYDEARLLSPTSTIRSSDDNVSPSNSSRNSRAKREGESESQQANNAHTHQPPKES